MYRVADLIKEYFLSKGIDTCFCVTGGGAMHFNDSFGHDPRLHTVYNHHEQASAIAAEGYARCSSKPAIVSVTSGPGSTNAITGVVGAWLDSIPMVILSGQMKRETLISASRLPLRQLGFQEFNIIDSVQCMTKYAKVLTDHDTILEELDIAYNLMMTGRKGPVWLDVPLDVQAIKVKELNLPLFNQSSPSTTLHDKYSHSFHSILAGLKSSLRPVLMVGYEIRMDDSISFFLELIDILGIPVVTEWNSHDVISDDNFLNSGRPGTIGDRAGNFVVQQSDFLLCIGCQLSIRQISYVWNNFASKAFKVGVSSDSSELQKPTVSFDLTVNCGVGEFMSAFSAYLFNHSYSCVHHEWRSWARDIYLKYSINNKPQYLDDSHGLSVYDFFKALSNVLPAYSTTVLANGAACVAGLQTIKSKKDQRFFTNAGASGMGYAIAASIGVSTYCGNSSSVICVEGDGSIQMNIQELQTIVHNNLNIKIFWLNNDGYQSIKLTQKGMFNAETKGYCGAGPDSGLSCPSAEKIANAYDIPFCKLCVNDDLHRLKHILRSHGPLIVEVVLNPFENFEPKLQSKLNQDGTFTTPSLEDMAPFLSREEILSTYF